MVAKKYKRLTNKEKQINKEAKKRLQEEGFLPLDKPRLNRKKFADEVLEEYERIGSVNVWRIHEALMYMLPCRSDKKIIGSVNSENVAALKILKIAIEIQKFWDSNDEDKKVTALEFYKKVVMPIKNL